VAPTAEGWWLPMANDHKKASMVIITANHNRSDIQTVAMVTWRDFDNDSKQQQ